MGARIRTADRWWDEGDAIALAHTLFGRKNPDRQDYPRRPYSVCVSIFTIALFALASPSITSK